MSEFNKPVKYKAVLKEKKRLTAKIFLAMDEKGIYFS